jgi:hypothetical protein
MRVAVARAPKLVARCQGSWRPAGFARRPSTYGPRTVQRANDCGCARERAERLVHRCPLKTPVSPNRYRSGHGAGQRPPVGEAGGAPGQRAVDRDGRSHTLPGVVPDRDADGCRRAGRGRCRAPALAPQRPARSPALTKRRLGRPGRVTGALGGRPGSFVLERRAAMGEGRPTVLEASIVPGSGTGALAGIRGMAGLPTSCSSWTSTCPTRTPAGHRRGSRSPRRGVPS